MKSPSRYGNVGGNRRSRRSDVLDRPGCPGDEIFSIRTIRVATVMLPPRELTTQQASVDRRRLCLSVVFGDTDVLHTEEPKHRSGGDGGHAATLLVQPFGIALGRNAVAD